MKTLLQALLLTTSTLLLSQHALSYEVVTFETLKNLVETKKVESIETLLPQLPPAYLQNFVLLKNSPSAQGASPLNPRVLLFGESAQSVLAFNGSAEQRGFESIEMLEFKTETGKFEFHEIRFAEGKVTFSEANPRKCTGCHQGRDRELRPNWDEYPRWPNAYGSEDDFLSAEERSQLDIFLAARPSHPRYRHLVMPDQGPYFGERFGPFIGRPNLRLTSLLTRWNARKVANQLKALPQFPLWRDLALLETTGDEAAYQRALGAAQAKGLFTLADLAEIQNGLSVLDKMSDAAGLKVRDWNLKFLAEETPPQRSSRTFRVSKVSLVYFDGFFQMRDYVMGELWRSTDLGIAEKVLYSLFASNEGTKKFSEGIENYIKILDEISAPPQPDQDRSGLAPLLEDDLKGRTF